jgi:hypothetical protein
VPLVKAPDGRVWRVRRRWMPKRPGIFARSRSDAGDTARDAFWSMPDLGWDFDLGFDSLTGIVISALALITIGFLLFTVVIPLVALTLEAVLLVLLFAAGVIGRLVFGRPWRIEATTQGPPKERREVKAKGLRGSSEARDELMNEIASGR